MNEMSLCPPVHPSQDAKSIHDHTPALRFHMSFSRDSSPTLSIVLAVTFDRSSSFILQKVPELGLLGGLLRTRGRLQACGRRSLRQGQASPQALPGRTPTF